MAHSTTGLPFSDHNFVSMGLATTDQSHAVIIVIIIVIVIVIIIMLSSLCYRHCHRHYVIIIMLSTLPLFMPPRARVVPVFLSWLGPGSHREGGLTFCT